MLATSSWGGQTGTARTDQVNHNADALGHSLACQWGARHSKSHASHFERSTTRISMSWMRGRSQFFGTRYCASRPGTCSSAAGHNKQHDPLMCRRGKYHALLAPECECRTTMWWRKFMSAPNQHSPVKCIKPCSHMNRMSERSAYCRPQSSALGEYQLVLACPELKGRNFGSHCAMGGRNASGANRNPRVLGDEMGETSLKPWTTDMTLVSRSVEKHRCSRPRRFGCFLLFFVG